jgi:transcriptional regulator with XRE-family HTH domain
VNLGDKLKTLRGHKRVNQSDVAYYLNIDRSTYGKYETGDSSPDYDKLVKLADYYKVSIDYLLGRTDIKNPPETIAAHHEGDEWTEEELEDIEKFKEYVKMRREKKTP